MAGSLTEAGNNATGQDTADGTTWVESVDARTGGVIERVAPESTADDVAAACVEAKAAGAWLDGLSGAARADLLRACAASLEQAGERIVTVADRETALGRPRLTGELARTCGQLRLFAEVVEEGSYLDIAIDRPQPEAQPLPRPDLRRMMVPIGVVGVFGASNFPLAFSVAGGDTASALAAGCPVVVKAHPAHPATSEFIASRMRSALADAGGPAATLALVHGTEAGRALVQDSRVAAIGFTGSVAGGRALFDLASSRSHPIPFYGELGSLNPLVVLPGAAAQGGRSLGERTAESVLLGGGQFCTKPGLLLMPSGPDGDTVVAGLRSRAAETPPTHLLTPGIKEALTRATPDLTEGTKVLLRDSGANPTMSATLVEVSAKEILDRADLLEEHFGPFAVVARYADENELREVLGALEPCLVATMHAHESDHATAERHLRRLVAIAGRIVWNGFPTGVQVSWGMTHGGPYPATTNPLHTSVGASAIRRWLRPITYQDVPVELLPGEVVRPQVPHRIDGRLVSEAPG
jgi:NADP-dependent aldehyde dehydrogenase